MNWCQQESSCSERSLAIGFREEPRPHPHPGFRRMGPADGLFPCHQFWAVCIAPVWVPA